MNSKIIDNNNVNISRKILILLAVLLLIESMTIIFILFHNKNSINTQQRKINEKFTVYLKLSNDALTYEGTPNNLIDNRIYMANSYISSACSLYEYTSINEPNLGLLLSDYKYTFINIPLKTLKRNHQSFVKYMNDILDNKNPKDSIIKFDEYLKTLK